jgi:signal transduction histidine kinase
MASVPLPPADRASADIDAVDASGGAPSLRSRSPWLPRDREWLVLAGYGVTFLALHRLAILWGGVGYYSLWFPAAGVRLALFWRFGARLAPATALTEIIVQCLTGIIVFTQPEWPRGIFGVASPVLAYGIAVAVVRRVADGATGSLATAPMPLGLASVLAPLIAVAFALPWSIVRPDITNVANVRDVIVSLTGFAVGDMLGVLLVAPPLLWIADLSSGSTAMPAMVPSRRDIAEAVIVLGLALGLVGMLASIGLGLPATPVLLAIAWIGLRFGRAAAWAAIVVTAILVLPETVGAIPVDQRLALHMSLAAVTVVGYLAGSFADAEARALAAVARRDRMLFQAERLKTLRAMSVAVIHEISQPLSTLAIEARHLVEISAHADPDIAQTARLIERKTVTLSTLVRRLRRFGGRAVDEPSLLPVGGLIDTVAALARPEASVAGVVIRIAPVDPEWTVLAQEIEIAQALVNLVRNAVQATDDGVVEIAVTRRDERVAIAVVNHCADHPLVHEGMGVGSLVAKAIVEAHGGTLSRADRGLLRIAHVVTLPLVGTLTGDAA